MEYTFIINLHSTMLSIKLKTLDSNVDMLENLHSTMLSIKFERLQ